MYGWVAVWDLDNRTKDSGQVHEVINEAIGFFFYVVITVLPPVRNENRIRLPSQAYI